MKTSEEPPAPIERTVYPHGPTTTTTREEAPLQLERSPKSPVTTQEEFSTTTREGHHATTREEPKHTSLQERSTQTTIREVQPATTREEPTHHVRRRAPLHIAIIEDYPCPVQLERSPPPQLEC